MPTVKNTTQQILDAAGQFVTKQKGVWEHDDWEAFLDKMSAIGVKLDDNGKRNLGNVLEAAKYFYQAAPPVAPKRKAAPKKKTAAKKKAAAK